MKDPKLSLLNFKTPTRAKKQFQTACRERNQMMTSVLNQFIQDFIAAHQETRQSESDDVLAFFSDSQ